MSPIDEKKLDAMAGADALGALDAVHEAVHEAVEERVAKRAAHLRAVAKTPKSQATRERILAAASKIMVESGGTGFQMSEVSALCNMSKGSLYYYFKDRDELVAEVFSANIDRMLASLQQVVALELPATEALVRIVHEIGNQVSAGSPLALALTNELVRGEGGADLGASGVSRIAHLLAQLLERAKGEGDVRSDLDTELTSTFLTGGFLVALLLEQAKGKGGCSASLVEDLHALSLEGVASAAHRPGA